MTRYHDLYQLLEADFDETIGIRRHLHMYPELSFEESKTKAFIADKLRSYGYSNISENVGDGGILASLGDEKRGPTIALRADFDALPIQEETDFEFKSRHEGVMHACGHDAHTAILLSVAKVLKNYEKAIDGKIIFVFQHAEERYPGGAISIVNSGALDGVDAIYGLHVDGLSPYDGNVSVKDGYMCAASDHFDVFVQGKGGHGAHPETSVDATVAGAHIVEALQTIISRFKSPSDAGVLTVSSFTTGNMTENIISDTAHLMGTVRTYEPKTRDMIESKLSSVSSLTAQAMGATARIDYVRGYPSLFNTYKETQRVWEALSSYAILGTAIMGGEDFAYYLEKIPGCFFMVHAGYYEHDNAPHHHPRFSIDERSLLLGGKAFLDILSTYFHKEVDA